MKTIFTHYLICALWSSTDSHGEPLDSNYRISDIHPDSLEKLEKELDDFIQLLETEKIDWSDWSEEQFGHDFWLTRNGHGAGFWDRGLENGNLLTYWAKTFGSCDIYIGDDGKLYI